MDTESGFIIEWRIENFSEWCAEVHGNCIESPKSLADCFQYLELYPKGISGQDEHIVVRLVNMVNVNPYTCEISFLSSDGSQLYPKTVFSVKPNVKTLELPAGPKFGDVFSRIRDSDDVMTVRFRIIGPIYCEQLMCTTINVLKKTLKLNPILFKEIMAHVRTDLIIVHVYPACDCIGLKLTCNSDDKVLRFSIAPFREIQCPIAVEMCMSTLDIKEEIDTCVKEEHIFRDQSVWTFRHSLAKEELVARGTCVLFDLKIRTSYVILNPYFFNFDSRMVSIEPRDHDSSNVCSSTSSDISNQAEDAVTALTSDLMCLYQEQDFSDITLKCGDVTFPVHRNILSARSPVFKTMLSCDMKETSSGRVDINDLDPSTLARYLTYLYTGAVGEEGLQGESAFNLYYAADKYQVPSLKRECADYLNANVSISNVCDILSLASKHNDIELTSVACSFILKNYNDVLKSKEWKNFMSGEPVLAVETLTSFAVDGRLKDHVDKN